MLEDGSPLRSANLRWILSNCSHMFQSMFCRRKSIVRHLFLVVSWVWSPAVDQEGWLFQNDWRDVTMKCLCPFWHAACSVNIVRYIWQKMSLHPMKGVCASSGLNLYELVSIDWGTPSSHPLFFHLPHPIDLFPVNGQALRMTHLLFDASFEWAPMLEMSINGWTASVNPFQTRGSGSPEIQPHLKAHEMSSLPRMMYYMPQLTFWTFTKAAISKDLSSLSPHHSGCFNSDEFNCGWIFHLETVCLIWKWG